MAPLTASAPLVGRDRELALVTATLAERSCTAVVVAGPAGAGKTRLAAEARAIAERTGWSIRSVQATEAARQVPLAAFAALLPGGGDELDVLRRARSLVLADVGDGPVLLVVDDAHLLDPVSAALVLQLARSPGVSVLATVRHGAATPDAIDALWRDPDGRRIDLDALDEAGVAALATAVLDGPIATTCARVLWERSQGNPLAVEELVRAARASGALERRTGVWHLVGDAPVSTRLEELIEARLGPLTDDELDALALAALGDPLPLELLESLAGADLVAGLDRRGLLTVVAAPPDAAAPGGGPDRVRPTHPLHGEVACRRVGTLHRRRLLRALADAASAAAEPGSPDTSLRVAAWRLAAGDHTDPDLFLGAAVAAYERGDQRLTEDLAAAAWSAHPLPEAGHLLGFTLGRSGRSDEAEEVLARASALVDTADGDRWSATGGPGAARSAADDGGRLRSLIAVTRAENLFRGLGDVEAATAVSEAAEAAVADPSWRAELVANRAMFVLLGGRPDRALELVEPFLADPTAERPFVKAAYVAGPALAADGRTVEALALAHRALPIHERVWAADRFQTEPAVHHVTAVVAHAEAGELLAAEAYAEAMVAVTLEHANPHAVGFASLLAATVALRRGRPDRAVVLGREAASAFADAGYVGHQRWGLAAAAVAEALLGRSEEAVALVADADRLAWDTPIRFNESLVDEARAWARFTSGRSAEAREGLADAARRAEETGQRAGAATLWHTLARLGDPRPAAAALGELALVVDGALVGLRHAQAEALAIGDGDALDAVGPRFQALGAELDAAECAAEAAAAHRRAGSARAAARSATRARELAGRCGGAASPALAGVALATPLTAREREIATLAARGLPSRQIAEELTLSRRTVDNHLQRVYAKAGVTRRTDLAAVLGLDDD